MKCKIFIVKVLTIGIALNSLSVLSYANTEIPNRYQTLEGEYITIDDSTEGNLEEIEIFGNTVQDSNNLENIQSVGDLYVDEDGNPILDSQGREQYKIDLVSYDTPNGMRNIQGLSDMHKRLDYNTFTITNVNSDGSVFSNYTGIYFNVDNVDESLVGKQVKIKFKLLGLSGEASSINSTVPPYKWNGSGNERFDITLNKEQTRIVNITQTILNTPLFVFEVKPTSSPMYAKAQVEVIVLDDTYNENITSILLPCKLQKVGDVADRLYWNASKNRYVIEKNIYELKLDGTQSYIEYTPTETCNGYYFNTRDYRSYTSQNRTISNVKVVDQLAPGAVFNGEELSLSADHTYIKFSIPKDAMGSLTVNEYLKKFPITIYHVRYLMDSPTVISETIEANITSKLKIPTYEGETHIYTETESGACPILKVTVDRLHLLAKNSVEEAKVNSSVSNISMSRMYINMLPESLYKDQLQEQLNQVFSSDIVLDKKTATSNLDLYIKCENALMMSLSTNSITFEDFSGIEDMVKENAVQISINSSLPYSLNAYLPTEIQNSDKSATMDKQILNIKENSETAYQTFANTTDKIILKDNCSAGNNLIHGVDIKLKGGIAHEKDVYKTTIKFEVEQK